MRTQQDYETQPTLAVFDSPRRAAAAVDAVRDLCADMAGVERVSLGPGVYTMEDTTVPRTVGGVWRGALWGLVIGIAVGLILAFVIRRTEPIVLFWFAITGGGLGLLIGAFVGSITRSRFSNDTAGRFTVPAGGVAELVAVHTSGPEPRVRETLLLAGARGFLDPTEPAAVEALMTRGAVMEGESARRAA